MSGKEPLATFYVRNLPPTLPIDNILSLLRNQLPGIRSLTAIPRSKLKHPLPSTWLHAKSGHLTVEASDYITNPSWNRVHEALSGASADPVDPHCAVRFHETLQPLFLRFARSRGRRPKPPCVSRPESPLISPMTSPPNPLPPMESKAPTLVPHTSFNTGTAFIRESIVKMKEVHNQQAAILTDTILPWLENLDSWIKALHAQFVTAHPELKEASNWPIPPPSLRAAAPSTKILPETPPPQPQAFRSLRKNIPPQRPRAAHKQVERKRERSETISPLRDAPPPVQLSNDAKFNNTSSFITGAGT